LGAKFDDSTAALGAALIGKEAAAAAAVVAAAGTEPSESSPVDEPAVVGLSAADIEAARLKELEMQVFIVA
jgi:hypothetical protein